MITLAQLDDHHAVQTESRQWLKDHEDELSTCEKLHITARGNVCQKHQDYLRHSAADGTIIPEFSVCLDCERFNRRPLETDRKCTGIGRRMTKKGQDAYREHAARQADGFNSKGSKRDTDWIEDWRARRKAAMDAEKAANPRLT